MRGLILLLCVLLCGQAFAGVMEATQAQPQTASVVVAGIKRVNYQEFARRASFVKQTYDMVWNNKQFTPEQIITAMGTDAVALFTNHGNEQIALATLAQQNGITYTPLAVPANYTLTPQQDGSIVVVKLPDPEPQPEQPEGGGEN